MKFNYDEDSPLPPQMLKLLFFFFFFPREDNRGYELQGGQAREISNVGTLITLLRNCHSEDCSPDSHHCFLILKYMY